MSEVHLEEAPQDTPPGTQETMPAGVPEDAPAQALPAAGVLGLLQAHERNGALVGRVNVTSWPVTVGRAMHADLVLDDPHIAPEHLCIDQDPDGRVTVQVLDTVNGVAQHRRKWRSGEQFTWLPGEDLVLGRLKLALRLAGETLPAEQPLHDFPWRTTGWTVALVGAVLALMTGMMWLETTESGVLAQRLPAFLAATVASMAAWAGLWALATRLFTGRLWFWRHVRIACAALLGAQALETAAHLLAFVLSWESFARFDVLISVAAAAAGVFAHLMVIAPQRRRGMTAIVAGVALLGMAVLLSTSWLQTRRLTSQLYMANVFPPSWRLAPAVPVPQFLQEAQSIRQRLEKRLKAKEDDDDPVSEPEEE